MAAIFSRDNLRATQCDLYGTERERGSWLAGSTAMWIYMDSRELVVERADS